MLTIHKPFAKIQRTDLGGMTTPGVRAYKHDPENVALQIWGQPAARSISFAHVNLSRSEALELAELLVRTANDLREA